MSWSLLKYQRLFGETVDPAEPPADGVEPDEPDDLEVDDISPSDAIDHCAACIPTPAEVIRESYKFKTISKRYETLLIL